MTKKRKAIIIVAVLTAVLAGIVGYRIYSNINANKQRASRASQGQLVSVEVAAVKRMDLLPVLFYSANMDPLWSADISPKVDGRIDQVLVNEGDLVQAGALVASMDTDELAALVVQAEGNLFQARSNLEQAESDLRRMAPLAQQGAISIQTYEQTKSKRDVAAGSVRAAAGNLTLLRSRLDSGQVVAPRDGVVTKRYIQSGTYAKAGTPVVTMADVSSLLAKATVGEAEVAQISVGTKVKVLVDALNGQEFEGVITRISPVAIMPSRTFVAEVTISNSQRIMKAGMFAKVEIPGRLRLQALVVPETALVMREDQKTVYVVDAENKVQQRLIRLGYVGGGWAEVLEGLAEGDRIVVAGQNKLKDGATIKIGKPGEGGV